MSRSCESCKNRLCARKVPIFANLSREELMEIIAMTGHEKYDKGDNIFFEGLEGNTLYIINQGQIKLFKYTKDGKEQILHILSDGDFFGELNLLKGGEYHFNAEAITTAKLCTLTKDKMKSIVLEYPEIGLKIMEVLGERISNLETLAQNLATNEVEVRIANLLLDLEDKYGQETAKGVEMKVPITREDMSNYTGVARETISRKLKKFEEEGIIKLVGNKKIVIIDKDKLKEYS
ncbi:Crp/Fnr family transcriptional regulator [Orenia marismortui]|uniref:CRP/FNR family transcriptional regulator n=1 Tax=Orenia marismortui TaxID=46469 RepID=A0A4R8GR84_9FIRM|nr:Crp/Fnr family transcriptional regulator [Orenia marismortui]TDX48360.1 CRP/FNR family transcriptional regulator [Orenia marismortui]